MQVSGKVIKRKKDEKGKIFALIQLNINAPKEGTLVKVKWGKARSLKQNNLYWEYLTWLIDEGGMQDQGYLTPLDLHEALKGHFLAVRGKDHNGLSFIRIRSTTELDASEFMGYMEKIDTLMTTFFDIDIGPFWREYAENYAR